MTIHELIDTKYGPDGDRVLTRMLDDGTDLDARNAEGETPLHVAARRRRCSAIQILLDRGASIDARNGHGKTAYAHAIRRGFIDVAALLADREANIDLNVADRLAVAIVAGEIDEARALAAQHPEAVRTGNSEEDRLLADVSGRSELEPVTFLIEAGADLRAPGLDDGTPLHQAAWFGQPRNARALIEAGAPLDVFEQVHGSSPIHWAAHGSRFSGGAEERQAAYAEVMRLLLDAGSSLSYPDDESDDYYRRLMDDSSPRVRDVLRKHGAP